MTPSILIHSVQQYPIGDVDPYGEHVHPSDSYEPHHYNAQHIVKILVARRVGSDDSGTKLPMSQLADFSAEGLEIGELIFGEIGFGVMARRDEEDGNG